MESELIKQWNSNPKPQTPLGIFGVLKESFKTIKRNRNLLFPVLVLVFLFYSQLEFTEVYLLQPVADDLSLQLAKNPKLFQDLDNNNNMHQYDHKYAFKATRELLLVKLFILTLSSIINLVFLVATVSSSSEAYTSKVIDLKEMILKIKKSWQKPILTSFYMILIIVGLLSVTFFIGIISILAIDTWAYLSYGVPFLFITVVGFYLSAVWMTSLVVSVLEDVSGLKANVRAIELMKGQKVQASLIMVFFALAYYGLLHSMTNAITSNNLDKWTQLAVSIPFSNGLSCALKLFMFVVFTVFYHEQKKSFDEKEEKGIYVPIVVGEV